MRPKEMLKKAINILRKKKKKKYLKWERIRSQNKKKQK